MMPVGPSSGQEDEPSDLRGKECCSVKQTILER
jgi:hypothetical protein